MRVRMAFFSGCFVVLRTPRAGIGTFFVGVVIRAVWLLPRFVGLLLAGFDIFFVDLAHCGYLGMPFSLDDLFLSTALREWRMEPGLNAIVSWPFHVSALSKVLFGQDSRGTHRPQR